MKDDPFDCLGIEDLRLPDSFLQSRQKLPASEAKTNRQRSKLQFYQFPKEVLQCAGKAGRNAQSMLIVLLALFDAHFHQFKRNPVRLTSDSSKEYCLSRHQKRRALQLWEKTGHLTVQREHGKNPLVTLNWLPIRK